MNDTLDFRLRGYVRVSNEAGQVVESKNLVVYAAADILTRLIGGLSSYKLSHLYFAFSNTAPPTWTAQRTDTADLFRDWFTASSGNGDIVRAQLLAPTFSTSNGSLYTANRATFSAVASAAAGVNAVPFSQAQSSQVFSLGIVASPLDAIESDVLYAHYVLPTALPVIGSGQISATWMLEAT